MPATTTPEPATISSNGNAPSNGRFLLDMLLEEQQQTAVERFDQFHETTVESEQQSHYRELIPLSAPAEGEQYAFEVDLDACSGCKACVAACHNLNGLEEDETWRNVGLLIGGDSELPALQHVTTACHHCIDPACLIGCPVKAYDKDPVTGIVRHLDDQCIGCQYCIFKCPYDVPVYSKSKGIVRKCDMCSDRLAVGEAPSCVQSCPNEAIRIRTVDRQHIIDDAQGNQFLPGAPEPGYTLPTTIYKTDRKLPRNMLPADYYSARRQHAHMPLVWMLVLTQMSVGAFVAKQWLLPGESADGLAGSLQLIGALMMGLLGLGAAVFHLGRPMFAFRALLGLRTSWLSREILAFGLFAKLAVVYVACAFGRVVGVISSTWPEQLFGALAAATGIVGVLCSVMIYVDTRRPFWNAPRTSLQFVLTSLVLGIPLAHAIYVWATLLGGPGQVGGATSIDGARVYRLLMAVVVAKLATELSVLRHLSDKQHTPLKRTATLLLGELSQIELLRLFFGIVGGVLLPTILMAEDVLAPPDGFAPLFVGVATVLLLALLCIGELLARYLFFTASVAPKMPGVQAA